MGHFQASIHFRNNMCWLIFEKSQQPETQIEMDFFGWELRIRSLKNVFIVYIPDEVVVGGLAGDIGRLDVATAAIRWPAAAAVGDFNANLVGVADEPAAVGNRIKSFPEMHILLI